MLLWLPSAVACREHSTATRCKRWPCVLAALAVARSGDGPDDRRSRFVASLGYATASFAEALLCTWIGMRVLGGRGRAPGKPSAHIAGLFAAALIGSAVGSCADRLSVPAREGLGELARLVSLRSARRSGTATPVLLYISQRLGFGDQRPIRERDDHRARGLAIVTRRHVRRLAAWCLPVSTHAATSGCSWRAWCSRSSATGSSARALGVLAIAYAAAGRSTASAASSPAPYPRCSTRAGAALHAAGGQMLAMLGDRRCRIAAMLLTRDRLEQAIARSATTTLRARPDASCSLDRDASPASAAGDTTSDTAPPELVRAHARAQRPVARDAGPDPGNMRKLLPDGGDELFAEIGGTRARRAARTASNIASASPTAAEHILKTHRDQRIRVSRATSASRCSRWRWT